MKTIFEKDYTDEDIPDMEYDVWEVIESLPKDMRGFVKGKFHVTITWSEDE